jgi:hypothetical protein
VRPPELHAAGADGGNGGGSVLGAFADLLVRMRSGRAVR